jgi:hypothetical protein
MTARTFKHVYLDSEERISGSASNFLYEIIIPDGLKVDTCCVLSMTVPRSYYLVRPGQNQAILILAGEGGASPVEHPFKIDPGNYNVDNFRETLLAILNGIATPAPGMPAAFTITYSGITGKYTYGYTGPGTAAFKFEDPSRLGHQLGFGEVSVNPFVATGSPATMLLTSANVVNFVSTSTLFLHSDMVDDSTSILQEVYADNSVPFANLVYNCRVPGMYSKKMKNTRSAVFSFSLCDEHDKEVDLNGHDICVTLLLYQKEDLTKTFQRGFEALIRAQD